MKMPSVLFLCSGNSARSQMAEGYLKFMFPNQVKVESAGSEPKTLHPLAVHVMKELGVDISHQFSKSVGNFSGRVFDYVITVCSRAQERCPFLSYRMKKIHWDLEDPAAAKGTDEEKLMVFRRVRDEIINRIGKFLSEELNLRCNEGKIHGSLSG